MPRVFVTGACGQLGIGMVRELRRRFGAANVLATDIRPGMGAQVPGCCYADVTDPLRLRQLIVEHETDWIVHLSALLSFVGEQRPEEALRVNLHGFQTILEGRVHWGVVSRAYRLRLFCPSTIGVFGVSARCRQGDGVPDAHWPVVEYSAPTHPTTIYGITKVHVELMGQYYHDRYGVDFRSLRYPGILSSDTEPGGGTTDYAIDLFHHLLDPVALERHATAAAHSLADMPLIRTYACPLSANTRLPMMHVEDCLRGTVDLLECDPDRLRVHDHGVHPALPAMRTYHLAALSFTPAELAAEVTAFLAGRRLHLSMSSLAAGSGSPKHPGLELQLAMDYTRLDPVREKIAHSWPGVLDDGRARRMWGWQPRIHTLTQLVARMMTDMAQSRGWQWRSPS